jgi:hypothetical protein
MQQHQQQQQHLQHQANMHMMSQGGMGGEPMIKPERPNSLGPKLSKRINFYHDNCKSRLASVDSRNLTSSIIPFADQDNQKKTPESPMQSNNSIISNNQMSQQHQHHHQALQQQLQQHLSGGYMSNGMSGSGVGGSGNNVGNVHSLSELPEPPISVSEIGPIPPPPMFSTPSPTMISGRPHGPAVHHHDYDYDGEFKSLEGR